MRSVVGVGEECVEAGEGVRDRAVGVHGGAVVAEFAESFVAECFDEEAGGLAAGVDEQAAAVRRVRRARAPFARRSLPSWWSGVASR